MKTFKVNGDAGSYLITLPQSLNEIGTDYLKQCTDFINPAPNYAVVAVVYKDSLSLILTAYKKKTATNMAVVPVFIKAGTNDSKFIKSIELGDKVVVSGSDLSIGHHIQAPFNKITPTIITALCEGDKDIYKEAMLMTEPVCFVEFKLVPISAIHAKLDDIKTSFNNPFVTNVSKDNVKH